MIVPDATQSLEDMPAKNRTLHGNAPDKAAVAILIIDIINDLEFPEGDQLLQHAVPMARAIAVLKQRAKQACVLVVYVNDNFGRCPSNFNSQVEQCLRDGVRGKPNTPRVNRLALEQMEQYCTPISGHRHNWI
jgi:hypothetical protein